MSSIYSMIMTMVLVATIAQFTNSDEVSASSFFFVFLIILFFITGCLHPQEIFNLVYGTRWLYQVAMYCWSFTQFVTCTVRHRSFNRIYLLFRLKAADRLHY